MGTPHDFLDGLAGFYAILAEIRNSRRDADDPLDVKGELAWSEKPARSATSTKPNSPSSGGAALVQCGARPGTIVASRGNGSSCTTKYRLTLNCGWLTKVFWKRCRQRDKLITNNL
jgi:hypothetical protein